MIRRELKPPNAPATWLLIPQAEHARLAGVLADAWIDRALPGELQAATQWAIYHHDDGWQEWDAQPELNSQGQPTDFREVAHETANRLWMQSIEWAADRGPLEAYLVASHFLDLRAASLRRAIDGNLQPQRNGHPPNPHPPLPPCSGAPEDCEFTLQYEQKARDWHREVLRDPKTKGLASRIDQANLRLQHFDWLSLLLCCHPTHRREPLPERLEGDLRVELVPQANWEFTFNHWPLRVESLELTAQCQEVVVDHYASTAEMLAGAKPRVLTWQLRRNHCGETKSLRRK